MAPNARRGPWSQAEDQFLLSIVQQQGANNWVRISQMLRTRTPKQCRERFHQNLKPSLNHDPITPEEGEIIERLVAEMGKKWAEIARQLNGRSDNAVKNWWNGGQNRRRRMSERRRSEAHTAVQQHQANQYHHHHHQSQYQHHSSPAYAHMNEQFHQPQYHPRPAPLTIQPHSYSSRAYDTPMPSPSGQSVLSTDGAPSLITDSGSESRSPHYAPSPMEHPLPPLIGRRDERRRSSLAFLPRNGSFITDDENQLAPLRASSADHQDAAARKRESLRLPEPPSFVSNGGSPIFREPSYSSTPSRSLPLLTQPFSGSNEDSRRGSPIQPSPERPRSGSVFPQQALPSFSELVQHPVRAHSVAGSLAPGPYLPPMKPRSPSSKPNDVASILN